MPLDPTLARIPGLAGYLAMDQYNRGAERDTMQRAGALQGILAKVQAAQQEQAYRSGLRPDMTTEQQIAHAAQFSGPEAVLRTGTSHLDRQATIEAARTNQQAQREARIAEIAQRGEQEIARVREAEAQRRITKEEADRREATMRENLARLAASLRPAPADKTPMGYRASASGNLEPIPGGPADTKIQGALNQDTSILQESQSGMDRLQAEANRLLNHPGLSKTTGIMSIVPLAGGLATVPGTDAANFKAGLENLKSQVGFSVLQQMRNNSKTGGALGQISDRENILLQNNLAALDRAQSEPEFKAALDRIIKYTEGAKNRLRNAYNIKHGGRQAPSPQPQTETPEFATEDDAIKSGVKGNVIIGGRKAKID